MATRRSVNTQPKESLDDMILIYAGKKEELDPLKKLVDEYGKKIKYEMTDKDLSEYTVGDVRASISVTQKEDFNELQAIEILRKNLTPEQFSKAVKTREYLDDDAFEALVYNHEVDAAILNPCRIPKEPTVTLRLGKAKK